MKRIYLLVVAFSLMTTIVHANSLSRKLAYTSREALKVDISFIPNNISTNFIDQETDFLIYKVSGANLIQFLNEIKIWSSNLSFDGMQTCLYWDEVVNFVTVAGKTLVQNATYQVSFPHSIEPELVSHINQYMTLVQKSTVWLTLNTDIKLEDNLMMIDHIKNN